MAILFPYFDIYWEWDNSSVIQYIEIYSLVLGNDAPNGFFCENSVQLYYSAHAIFAVSIITARGQQTIEGVQFSGALAHVEP